MRFFVFILSLIIAISNLEAQTFAKYNSSEEPVKENELRILTWNIKMLPRLIKRVRVAPIKRARIIPQKVIDDQIDIVVFEELFDVRARRIIKRGLKADYPYHYGPANKKFFTLKTNSGVAIYSKIPIKHLEEIDFDQCEGDDCLARKGAMLVEGKYEGVTFQLLGTHLEAGGTKEMKRSQYEEIKELIDRHRKDGVPQLLAGDFNTHKKDEDLYHSMLDTLQARDVPIEGNLQYTSDEVRNDMNPAGKRGPKQSVIDYILYKGNGFEPKAMHRYVREYQQKWRVDHSDLSDHNAVLMRLVLK